MKKLFTSILFLFAVKQGFGQDYKISWQTPIVVSSGVTGNMHPRITLNSTGNPLIVWGQSDTAAYFTRMTSSGFTTPLKLNTAFTVFAQSWAGPDIASNGNKVYVVMKRNPETSDTNHCYLMHSYDDGATFSAPVRIDNIDTSLSRFPIVTTTPNGNPLVAFMKFNASFGDARYVVSRSSDFGNTFSSDALASGTAGEVCDCCPASIISSGNNAIVLFRNNLSNIRDIWAGVSNDSGATFPTHFATDSTNWMLMSCPSSGPDGFVIYGDDIYSVFMSGGTGKPLVYLNYSKISTGTSFSTTQISRSTTGINQQNFPRIANYHQMTTAVWKQSGSSSNMLCSAFTYNIGTGFQKFDTFAIGNGLTNPDIAMGYGFVHVVYEDANSGKLIYIKGTFPTSSVADINTATQIYLYPNPANSTFAINLDGINAITSAALVDAAGKRIELNASIKGDKVVFSLSGIAKGNYYFSASDDSGNIYYSKLAVE